MRKLEISLTEEQYQHIQEEIKYGGRTMLEEETMGDILSRSTWEFQTSILILKWITSIRSTWGKYNGNLEVRSTQLEVQSRR